MSLSHGSKTTKYTHKTLPPSQIYPIPAPNSHIKHYTPHIMSNNSAAITTIGLQYPIIHFSNIYNPFRPWIIEEMNPQTTLETGTRVTIGKTNVDILWLNRQTTKSIILETITEFNKTHVTYFASADPNAEMSTALYIKVPIEWTKLDLQHTIRYIIRYHNTPLH